MPHQPELIPTEPLPEQAARNAEREKYLARLRQKLQDPDFREIALTERQVADLAASFQEAVVDCLVGKALLALRRTGRDTLCVGGGVAANGRLRRRLEEAAAEKRVRLIVAPLALCTDNAVMGAIAVERLKAGLVESLELDVEPGVIRNSK